MNMQIISAKDYGEGPSDARNWARGCVHDG